MGVHDQLLKELGTAFPADLTTLMMPKIANRVDLQVLDFTTREYFLDTPLGRRRYPDLVSKTRGQQNPDNKSVIHLELFFKFLTRSKSRVWDYNRLLAMRHQLAVHSAAIYIRGGPEGLESIVHEEVSHGEVICRFYYHSLGLSRARAEDYLPLDIPLAWAFASVMKPGPYGSQAKLAIACLERIRTATWLDEARRFLLLQFVRTYVKLDNRVFQEYEELLREPENVEIQDMMMTWSDEMKAEGHLEGEVKGRLEGEVKGRLEGEVKGLRDAAFRLLTQRFGTPSEKIRQHLAQITSPKDLLQLIDNVLDAGSPEELGLA